MLFCRRPVAYYFQKNCFFALKKLFFRCKKTVFFQINTARGGINRA